MITIKTPQEIKKLRQGGQILAKIIREVIRQIKPGISIFELDQLAEELIKKAGGRPSFKGFEGYPTAACISINEEVVHAIPRKEKILKEGDIVGVDIGLEYEGLYTDMARTVAVGRISKKTNRLLKVTQKALAIGIKQVKPGQTTGDIGQAIQHYVEKHGFSVVRSLVGHGVGHQVHEEPRLPNFGRKGEGEVLKEGMVLALEPMVNVGGSDVITKEDKWTIITADGSLSAHFEDTVAVTRQGAEILTK